MKKILFSVLIALSFASISCSKDEKEPQTPTPTVKTPEEYLTAKTWLVDELTYLQSNTLTNYKRSSGSPAFRNDKLTFKTDGTGKYNNTYNEQFDITWQFSDAEKSKINMVIKGYSNGGPAATNQSIILENVNVKESSLKYTEIYLTGTLYTMSSVYRIAE
ncbi:MAG: hypothetical protein ACTHMV_09745 [Chitinophagaceae bacterium]